MAELDLQTLIDAMIADRAEKNVTSTEKHTQDFWLWYALTLLPKVSHRSWSWNDKLVRRSASLHRCVSVSDEALALQVLDLRGEGYLELKKSLMKKKREAEKALKGETETSMDDGGKSAGTKGVDIGSKEAGGKNVENGQNEGSTPKKKAVKLTFNAGVFMKYHAKISGVRQVDKRDENGWCLWLNVKEMEKMAGAGVSLESGTETKISKHEDAVNTLNELDLPIDCETCTDAGACTAAAVLEEVAKATPVAL